MVGEAASSQSGKFTFLNCFDGNTGTLACVVKEGVKLYFYNIRSSHVERARHKAIEAAIIDAMSQGMDPKDAALQAQQEGKKAAKLATRKAKRIIGPIISSGWDFFEAIYFGGTMTEGFLRGTGTLIGTYAIGFHGEQRLGRVGYLVGSHLGSWFGGRIGLMVYDVVNGVHYLLYPTEPPGENSSSEAVPVTDSKDLFSSVLEYFQPSVNGNILIDIISKLISQVYPATPFLTSDYETSEFGSSKSSDDSYAYENPDFTTSEASEESNDYETPYKNYETHEEF